MKKVLVALEPEVLAAIDARCSNRSQFIREAIAAALGNVGFIVEDERTRKEREFDEFLGVAEWQEYLHKRDGR